MNSVRTKSFLARTALAIAIVAGGVIAVSTPASAATGGWERIRAFNSQLVVTVPAPDTENNRQVDMEAYDSMHYPGQWMRTPVATNTFTFENRWSHQCLDTLDGNGSAAEIGTPVVQMPCDDSSSQRWLLTLDETYSVWHISNVSTGLFLGVDGGSSDAGAVLIQGKELPNNTSRMFQIW
jgi:hypothetical protein